MSTEPTTPDLDVLVDLKTVCRSLCRSRASVYRDIERNVFPRPVKLGHSSRWRSSDLRAFIAAASPAAA
jgi:prophage regulatory protein